MTEERSMWRRLWDRLSLGQLRWVALVAILATSAAFGGLDRANHVKPVTFGSTYAAGPLKITPQSITLIDYLPKLPELPPDCRFLVLAAKIENTAHASVPLQPPSAGTAPDLDCHTPIASSPRNVFEMQHPKANYAGVFRGAENTKIPVIEPGFSYDYSVVWTVPLATVADDPSIIIRIYEMTSYVSAFRIARDWGRTETVKYAELKATAEGAR